MGSIVMWMLVAVGLAVGVLAITASSQPTSGVRHVVGALRSRLAGHRTGAEDGTTTPSGGDDETTTELALEEVGIEDLFSLGQTDEASYLSTDELQETLNRARAAAARRIPPLSR